MHDARGWDSRYEWKTVALLTLGFGLVGLDRWIVAPLSPAMIRELGLIPQDINNMVAVLGIAWGFSAILLGGLSDRIGRRKVLIPAVVVFSLLSGFSGAALGMTSLLVIRALMGVSEGAFCPTSFACVAEASKPSRRGFNQGFQQGAFALFGLGFGPIIATQFLSHGVSWRGVFLLVGAPGLLLALLLWFLIREPLTAQGLGESATRAPLSNVLKNRNVPLAMLALLCAMCGIFVLSANTPIYLVSTLHLSEAQMGFVASAIGFGGFLGQWLLSAASDYLGRKVMAIAGFAVGAVFVWLFTQIGPDPLLLFIILFIGAGFAFGLLSLLAGPIAVEAAPLGLISTAAGLIIGAGEIFGGGIAPVIAGHIATSYGLPAVLDFAICGLALGAVVSLFLKETAPRKAGGSALDRLEQSMGSATDTKV